MCRYAEHDYPTSWVCVPCRNVASRPRVTHPNKPRCPTCRRIMIDMGRDFKAPRRGNHPRWAIVALLADHNIRFDSCGCTGPGWRPRTWSEAKRYAASLRVTL